MDTTLHYHQTSAVQKVTFRDKIRKSIPRGVANGVTPDLKIKKELPPQIKSKCHPDLRDLKLSVYFGLFAIDVKFKKS